MDLRDADAEFMRQALAQAARGRPTTSPNPMVGCVIVTPDGVVAGRGHHVRAGEPHAEVHALRAAGPRARGATLYVTLEPCSHTGRTGPCVEPILEAGVARVVAAMADPNPMVAGRGIAWLRQRGVAVEVGLHQADAARLNEAFVTAMTRQRPFVLLKIATSIDGRIATAPGTPVRLTSHEADLWVHRTRAEVDAIAVGADTVVADDPRLTARLVHRSRPLRRVLVDWRLRVPASARVFEGAALDPVMVVTSPEAVERNPAHAAALRGLGAELSVQPAYDLPAVFASLHAREIRSVLVEGGASLHRACIAHGLADRLHLYVAPHAIGPAGLAWDVGPCCLDVPERVVPLGPDVLIDTYVHRTH